MSNLRRGFDFLDGLLAGALGVLVLVIALIAERLLTGFTGAATAGTLLVYLGIGATVGGPAWFWVLRPLYYEFVR
ncbi:MAG: hypothetical protein ABEJ08_05935 [Halobacteriaceae archaeon]